MAQIATDDDFLERKFTDNFTYLQEKLSKITDIVDNLIEKRVINGCDRLKFLNVNKSQKEKIDDVLQEVMTKKKFNEFIFALRKTGQSTLTEKLTLNNTEFGAYINSQEQEAVGSLKKSVREMQKEPTKQANKATVDAKRREPIKQANGGIEVEKLKNEKQELLRKINEQTAKIKNLEKQNTLTCREKENLARKVANLEKDLKTLREELKQKTEIIKKMEAHQKSIEGSLQQIKKDRKEDREKDKKIQTNTEATMKLMMTKLQKLEMKPLQNRTSDLRANRK